MKQRYKKITFNDANRSMVDTVDQIVEEYMEQGFVLTTRQVYYQLVARGLFPSDRRWTYNASEGKWERDPDGTQNAEPNYKWVAGLINDAKLAGYLDWDGMEDRVRTFRRRSRWDSPSELLRASAKQYHEDMWIGQKVRPFVIVEKDALGGVLEGVCHELDVPLLAARGYPSGSVLREFAVEDLLPCLMRNGRMKDKTDRQQFRIIHLGDHDPSGIDMTRDLAERLYLFVTSQDDGMLGDNNMRRVALNMDQIRKLNPPSDPAKQSDARYRRYAKQHGEECWELDALEPKFLVDLVRKEVGACIDDRKKWNERVEAVKDARARLLKVAEQWDHEAGQ